MRIGVDVGGTHTDAVLLDRQEVLSATKVLTTANVRDVVVKALEVVSPRAVGFDFDCRPINSL